MEYKLELYHHGTKGQKWGIRRYQNKDGSLTPAGKKRYSQEMAALKAEEKAIKTREATKAKLQKLEDKRKELDERKKALDSEVVESSESKPTKISKRKSIRKMSTEELKARISRLEMEKQLKELEGKTQSKGKTFVMDVLEAAGKNILTQATTYAMGVALNKAVKATGYTNATQTITENGQKKVKKIFEDIVNPRKGQKDK
jgi:hypothetical protein